MYQQRRNSQTNLPQQQSANPFSFGPKTFPVERAQRAREHDTRNIAELSTQEPVVDFGQWLNRDRPPYIDLYSTAANRVVKSDDGQAEQGISEWGRRIDQYKSSTDYLNLGKFSDNNGESLENKLNRCENILLRVMESVETEPETFRGLLDNRGYLQAAAIVKKRDAHLEVEDIVAAPWNIVETDFESVKGAGTALMEELTKESAELEFEGRLRVIAISGTQGFYEKIGFKETDREDWELTSEATERFLERQESRRRTMEA